MNKEKVIRTVDVTILIAVGVICAIYFCLELFGFKKVDFALMSFILLLAITLHFIAAMFLEMDLLTKHQDISTKIDTSTKTIIDSLKGVEIKLFDKIEDV